jgi:hypothetical protein
MPLLREDQLLPYGVKRSVMIDISKEILHPIISQRIGYYFGIIYVLDVESL